MPNKLLKLSAYILFILLITSSAFADTTEIGFSGAFIRQTRDMIFSYVEGSFGSLLLVSLAAGTIVSAAMGMFAQCKYLMFACLGIFSVKSLMVTFFPDNIERVVQITDNFTTSSTDNFSGNFTPPNPTPAPYAPPLPTSVPKPQATAKPKATSKPASPTALPTEKPTEAPTKTAQPTNTVKPAPTMTAVPTPKPKKCRGGQHCIITDSYCYCARHLEGDDPSCTDIGDIHCQFGS